MKLSEITKLLNQIIDHPYAATAATDLASCEYAIANYSNQIPVDLWGMINDRLAQAYALVFGP